MIQSPKFYFADVGVANLLARRGRLQPGAELFGKAFENWVGHELTAYRAYREAFEDLAYWRLASGIEVDFVIDAAKVAVEAKASANVQRDHLVGLRELAREYPRVKRRVVVCLESRPRRTEDGIDILPAQVFAERLWADRIVD